MGVGAGSAVALGVGLLGAGVSAYGAVEQGQAQSRAANYQAQVAKNNAITAQQNAAAVQDQATAKAVQDARTSSMRVSAQRAQLGANGVDPNSGSALDVTGATAGSGALTAANDQQQGAFQAYGYLSQASNFGAQAGLDKLTAANANEAGVVNAGSSFLSGASQVSSKWASYQNTTSPFNGPGR